MIPGVPSSRGNPPQRPSRSQRHIDHALVGKPHPPMYLLHKWWARKPHNIVRQYIEAYSAAGEVVLDPFAGSGPSVIEAVRVGRRGLGFDLDPLAVFITRMTALPVDLATFKRHYAELQKEVRGEIEALYQTTCKSCRSTVPVTHVIWADKYRCGNCRRVSLRGDVASHSAVNVCSHCEGSLDSGVKIGSEMLEIGYECRACMEKEPTGKRFLSKSPDAQDRKLIAEIEAAKIPAWYPDDRLYYPSGRPYEKKERAEKVSDFFEKRALISLARLYEAINELPKGRERDLMRLTFSSNLHSVSRLNMVHGPRWKAGTLPSRSWVIHSFYIPPLRIEFPVWFYFTERVGSRVGGS